MGFSTPSVFDDQVNLLLDSWKNTTPDSAHSDREVAFPPELVHELISLVLRMDDLIHLRCAVAILSACIFFGRVDSHVKIYPDELEIDRQ